MKFFSTEGCNIVVQLLEKKSARWFLLLGKSLQFQLNFKPVNSFRQANTWRPAAASPVCGLGLQEDRAAVCVGLRGRGCLWSDFPGDQCPLIHKPAVTLAGFLKLLVTPVLNNRLPSLHISHSQILLSAPTALHLLKPPPSLTWIRSLPKLPACSPQPRPPPTARSPQSGQLTWCCVMCFCLLPEAPTRGTAPQSQGLLICCPSLHRWPLELCPAHDRYAVSTGGAQGNCPGVLHSPGNISSGYCFMTTIEKVNFERPPISDPC